MKFAQSSVVYFNYTLQYAIKDLGKLGYDGIEIYGGRQHLYRDDLDDEMDSIKALLKENNMVVCNVIPAQFRYPSALCSDKEKIRTDSVAYIKTAIDNAATLNAPSINVCPGMVCMDKDLKAGWNALKKSFEELSDYAKDKNVLCLIEPAHKFETNLIYTIEDTLRMLDELKSEMFGILVDTGHCHVNGEDFRTELPKIKGIPLHIHIDDNNGDMDSHKIPGDGTVDFEGLKEGLTAVGYDGFVSAELGAGYIMDPTKACEDSLTALRNIFPA